MDVGRTVGRLGDGIDPPQHGEDARQRSDVAGHQALGLVAVQPPEVPGQRVDQRVDRLVGDRFLLVAPAAQDDRLAAFQQSLEEPREQRALAGARPAVDEHGAGPAAADGGERKVELGELRLAADEQPRPRGRPGCAGRARAAQPPDDLVAGRAVRRVATQQVDAQRVEVVRHGRVELFGRRGVGHPLLHHHVERTARERQPAGERPIEHHAHAVPVAGRRDRLAGRLLGGHVRRRAHDVAVGRRMVVLPALQLGRQAEIEQDHPRPPRDQHVGRLDVAVQPARGVQHLERLAELPQRGAEPHLVERRVRPRGAWLGPAARPGRSVGGRLAGRFGLHRVLGARP